MILAQSMTLNRSFTANSASHFGKFAVPAKRRPMIPSMLSNLLSAFGTWNPVIFGLIVSSAKTFNLGRFATYLAFQFRPSAFTTKSKPIFTFIATRFDTCPTSFAWNRCLKLPMMLIVVMFTKSKPKVFFSANCAWRFFVQLPMFNVIGAKLKIFYTVVICYFISMMNHLNSSKESSKMFLHDKPMLHHISIAITAWMVWTFNLDVSWFNLFLLSDLSLHNYNLLEEV